MSECVGHACVLTNYFYAAFTRRFACRANTGPANHNASAQTHFANILLAAFTMRLHTGKNQYYGNHNRSHAQNRRGPSGDHARRRPFCSLWTLRREPAQRRPRAPQALLQSLDTAERAGPAATTRAADPSAVSGHCGDSRPSGDHARCRPFCSLWTLRREPAQRRPRAPQALLQSLDTAERAGPAATTRRRPFCSLWTLRRQPAQRRPRAPQALLQSLDTAERAGPEATTRAAGPSAVSGHCGDSRPSGDHARRRPCCSLWTLRREPAQRRPRAPQALLQSLDTAERAGPAATTRAAGPSAVSGHCRPFCSLVSDGVSGVNE